MARFFTTQGTSYQLENIIKNAKMKLVLISPYLKLSQNLLERLIEADRKGIKTTIIYGKDDLAVEEKDKLINLKNLLLYFHKDLHAKCFFNEEHMIITSMNMYEYSQTKNREMGVLIGKEDDADAFREAMLEVKSIVDAAEKIDLSAFKSGNYGQRVEQMGHCIRCRQPIALDFNKPYCRKCYSEWQIWENPYYEEDFCLACGGRAITSMAKPLCPSCYRRISD